MIETHETGNRMKMLSTCSNYWQTVPQSRLFFTRSLSLSLPLSPHLFPFRFLCYCFTVPLQRYYSRTSCFSSFTADAVCSMNDSMHCSIGTLFIDWRLERVCKRVGVRIDCQHPISNYAIFHLHILWEFIEKIYIKSMLWHDLDYSHFVYHW